MSTRKIIGILQRMDQMIRMRSTGGPVEFSSRLGVSERTLYYYLSLLKELGASIHFSSGKDSYEYCEDVKINLKYENQRMG